MLTRPLCDSQQTTDLLVVVAGSCFGGYSGGETPGLIPNPEAKPSSADGTALGRVWESRTPPDSTHAKARPPLLGGGLSCFPRPFVGCAGAAFGVSWAARCVVALRRCAAAS